MKAKIQHEIQEYCSLLKLNAINEHFEAVLDDWSTQDKFLIAVETTSLNETTRIH
jgi:hypothetical protein